MIRALTPQEVIAHRSIIVHDERIARSDMARHASTLHRMEAFLSDVIENPEAYHRKPDQNSVVPSELVVRTKDDVSMALQNSGNAQIVLHHPKSVLGFHLPPRRWKDPDIVASTLRDVRIANHAVVRILENDGILPMSAFDAMADACEDIINLDDPPEEPDGSPRFLRFASPWHVALATGDHGHENGRMMERHWSLRERIAFILVDQENGRGRISGIDRWRERPPSDPMTMMRIIADEAEGSGSREIRRMAASLWKRATGEEG
jgi:hypothetical protein